MRFVISAAGYVVVPALTIVASAFGFVLQLLLASAFGTGPTVDSYLFAMSVPTFLAALASSALSYTATPALVSAENDRLARGELLGALGRKVLAAAAVFALIGWPASIVQPLLLPTGHDFSDSALGQMIIIGWCVGGAQLLSALLVIELNALRRPILAACLALPPNVGAIALVLIMKGSIQSVPLGVLVGTVCAILIGLALTRARIIEAMARRPRAIQKVDAARLAATLVAMSCFSAYAIVDAFWAPRIGSGVLSSLGYAQRLVIGIGGLLVAGPSAILVPKFAVRLRDFGFSSFAREVTRVVAIVGGGALLFAALIGFNAEGLVSLVFGRGEFAANDVEQVAAVLRAMMPGFCAMLMSVVMTRAVFCLEGAERSAAVAGALWVTVYAVLCGILLGWGAVGFGVSYSVAWTVHLGASIAIVRRYPGRRLIQ